MGKLSDFRIRSFQVVDAWRILQFNRKTEKYFKEFIWFFFCRGEGAATRRLPCLKVWVTLPWGRNLSSVDIAKCEPQVLRLEKTLKIGKNFNNAVVLVWGRQILENSS